MAQSKVNANCPGGVLYEIRKGGQVYASSYLENLGYPPQRLKEMSAAGYELYAAGKKVKRSRSA